jgi:hypothetical protein
MLINAVITEVENYINATIIVCICSVKNLVANYLNAKVFQDFVFMLFNSGYVIFPNGKNTIPELKLHN